MSAVSGCGDRCTVLNGYRAVLILRCCVYTEGFAATGGPQSDITIVNMGAIASGSRYDADGIFARSSLNNVSITNSGPIKATTDGIYAASIDGSVAIANAGDITAGVHGTDAYTGCVPSPYYSCGTNRISITNTAKIDAGEIGILAGGGPSHITIQNAGDITAGYAGIFAFTAYDKSSIAISTGFYDYSCSCSGNPELAPSGYGADSPISIVNTGIIDPAVGIAAVTLGPNSPIEIENTGNVAAIYVGIVAATYGENSSIHIVNSGTVATSGDVGAANVPFKVYGGGGYSVAIAAATIGTNSSLIVENRGDVNGNGDFGVGIVAFTYGASSKNVITNSGSVYGGYAAILAASNTGTTIINTGKISAGSDFAIGVYGGPTTIYNAGHIIGFVQLDADDTFINEKGGVFETNGTSDFDAFGIGATISS